MAVKGRTVLVSFARYRRAQLAVLMLLGALLAIAPVSLASVRSSALAAIEDSLRADLGHRGYALHTSTPEVLDILARAPGAAPVKDAVGTVGTSELAAPALVRVTTADDLHLGVVVEGQRPSRPGDVLVTSSIARALDLGPGSTAELSIDGAPAAAARVTGVTRDPADQASATVIHLADPAATDATGFTRWLSDTDFYDHEELQPYLDRRSASYQSLDSLVASALLAQPQYLSAMRGLPLGAALLVGVLLVSFTTLLMTQLRPDATALQAAGMTARAAYGRIVLVASLAVIAGVLAGLALTATVLFLARRRISSWFGQDWVGVEIDLALASRLLLVVCLGGALTLVAVRLAPVLRQALTRRSARARPRTWATAATVVAVAAGVALTWSLVAATRPGSGDAAWLVAPWAAVVLAAALPFALGPLLVTDLRPATRALANRVSGGLRPAAAVAAVIAVGAGLWSAQTTRSAADGEALSSPLVPAGSFVISDAPVEANDTLAQIYDERGGEQLLRFALLDEREQDLRVTSTALVSCAQDVPGGNLAEVPESCWPAADKTAAPVNVVMIGEPGSTPRADPGLVRDGQVGLMLFTGDDGSVARFATTDAAADPTLGGNLPGLVLPPESPVLQDFGAQPSGTELVALLDYTALQPEDQLYVRSAALRLAPGAQTADGTEPTAYDRLRTVANTVAVMGAGAATVVLLLGGVATAITHSVSRRTLVDLSTTARARRRVVLRWALVGVAPALLAVPLVFLVATSGLRAVGDQGWLWPVPAVGMLVAGIAAAAVFARVPPTRQE